MKYWRKIFSLMFFPRKLCAINATGIRADIITKGLCSTADVIKVFFYGVLALLFFYGGVPVYFFTFHGALEPLLPIEIIFVDQVY